jgi:hypothetical protein|tara:strand:- start:377 stop:1123 length:747 start_codon:yes stop_codon:yes gene_type:complete
MKLSNNQINLFSIILILLPNLLFSQVVNVEGKRQSDENGWSGTTEFSFDYNDSEQIDWEFNNTTFLQWDNDSWSLLLLNEINFDRAGGVNFENDGFQHLRLSNHINNNYTSETFLQNQFDPVRKIENRKLLGTGVRIKLSDRNFFGLSTFYEFETLTDDIINMDVRLSSYLQLDFNFSDKIQFLTTTYLQPNVKQFSDFKLSTESQLNFKITDHFSFTNTIEAIYDSFPAIGINKLSYRLQNGIQYKF